MDSPVSFVAACETLKYSRAPESNPEDGTEANSDHTDSRAAGDVG